MSEHPYQAKICNSKHPNINIIYINLSKWKENTYIIVTNILVGGNISESLEYFNPLLPANFLAAEPLVIPFPRVSFGLSSDLSLHLFS